MKMDDKFYTFLYTHSSRNKISIRRIEISKKWLHNSAAGLGIILFLSFIGFSGLSNQFDLTLSKVSAKTITESAPVPQQISFSNDQESKTINYERPQTSAIGENELTANSGGPVTGDFQLSNVESIEEENQMAAQIAAIERSGNSAFIPNIWAHSGKINNEFGYRRNPFGGRSYEFHPGLDIDGEKGDVVIAPANGTVVKAGWQGGYGNLIEIDHGNGLITRYGHLSKIEVEVGAIITRGQELGLIGSTGRSTGPHLHFEIRLGDKPINPRRFLPPEPAEVLALNRQ